MRTFEQLLEHIRSSEGLRLKPYQDALGLWTWGYGWCYERSPATTDEMTWLAANGFNRKSAEWMLERRVGQVFEQLAERLPWFDTLDSIRRHVLVDMAYNLGIDKLLQFSKTLAALEARDYPRAAGEMLESRWAAQVGPRAQLLAVWMKTDWSPKVRLEGSVGAGGQNRPADVQAVQRRLLELGHGWLEVNGHADKVTVWSIRLFQAIKHGFQTVGAHPENDGLIEPGKDTHLWLQALNAPRWQLMPRGAPGRGFVNVERRDENDKHDWGTDWLARACIEIAVSYRDRYLVTQPEASVMLINDVSLPRGGDTPDHERHETGLGCDLRLPRRPASLEGRVTVTDAAYDRDATRALLTAIRQHPAVSVAYLNDPALQAEGLCQPYPGHDDHIHFEILPPTRVNPVLEDQA